ncbi:MAG: prepilin peptidase [Candidatus Margulisiibacteriota bacterium]
MIYIAFIIGTIIGSFLNVCIYRLPKGESILFPASHCPNCKRELSFFDLIPILGYFLLRGKCRYCQEKIAVRYLIVEIAVGIAFAVIWLINGWNVFNFIFQATFVSLFISIFFMDLEHQVIPDLWIVFGLASGLMFNFFRTLFLSGGEFSSPSFVSSVSGAMLGFIFLYAIAKIGKKLLNKEVMGEGDYYVAAVLGAYLGWQNVFVAIFLSYLSASIIIVFLLLAKKVKFGDYIPFGPAFAVGGILTIFLGKTIIGSYLSLFL